MNQSTILKYAIQHLSNKIDRLNQLSILSESNRTLFEGDLQKYNSEHDEMIKMLNELQFLNN